MVYKTISPGFIDMDEICGNCGERYGEHFPPQDKAYCFPVYKNITFKPTGTYRNKSGAMFFGLQKFEVKRIKKRSYKLNY